MNSSNPSKKVFAVVVTYNGARWIRKCLQSLNESLYPVSIVVIDNGSKDDTIKIIKDNFPAVQVYEESTNLGFGQANNKGISIALNQNADYTFLLNQDAFVEPDTIGQLVKTEFDSKGFGVLSPLHMKGSGTGLDEGFKNCILKAKPAINSSSILKGEQNPAIIPVDFINAAAWMVSRAAFEIAGGFSPLFHQYGEDREYSIRLRFHLLKIGFVPNCKIYHDRDDRNPSPFFQSYEKLSWYYTVGVRARLVNVAMSLFICLWSMITWTIKECAFHVLKGRWYAFFSWFRIWRVIGGEIPEILQNRKLIKSGTKFLFLPIWKE